MQEEGSYGPTPKSCKSRQNLHKTILKGNSIVSNPKKIKKLKTQRKAHDLKKQDVG
jgi:hypothetical protein